MTPLRVSMPANLGSPAGAVPPTLNSPGRTEPTAFQLVLAATTPREREVADGPTPAVRAASPTRAAATELVTPSEAAPPPRHGHASHTVPRSSPAPEPQLPSALSLPHTQAPDGQGMMQGGSVPVEPQPAVNAHWFAPGAVPTPPRPDEGRSSAASDARSALSSASAPCVVGLAGVPHATADISRGRRGGAPPVRDGAIGPPVATKPAPATPSDTDDDDSADFPLATSPERRDALGTDPVSATGVVARSASTPLPTPVVVPPFPIAGVAPLPNPDAISSGANTMTAPPRSQAETLPQAASPPPVDANEGPPRSAAPNAEARPTAPQDLTQRSVAPPAHASVMGRPAAPLLPSPASPTPPAPLRAAPTSPGESSSAPTARMSTDTETTPFQTEPTAYSSVKKPRAPQATPASTTTTASPSTASPVEVPLSGDVSPVPTGTEPSIDNSLAASATRNVDPVTSDVPGEDSGGRVSATNIGVIRRAAFVEVVLPDLGRVSISAHARAGGIDAHVAASAATVTAVLLPHGLAMEADIRAANLPLLTLDISGAASETLAPPSTDLDDAHGQSSPEPRLDAPERERLPRAPARVRQRRVRIVL